MAIKRTVANPMQGTIIFVAGYGSGAGKSTTCLAIIASALRATEADVPGLGIAAQDVAYIKPATQCEAQTLVTEFCEARGVEAVPMGPIVFRKGFTNEVLKSDDYEAACESLLASAKASIASLTGRKKLVVVDGVGYPSVGACCGLGNARIAASIGAHVVLVGPPGLGDCIDTFDLMSTYFVAHGANLSAAIINKAVDTERHRLSDTLPLVEKWFARKLPAIQFLGAMPLSSSLSVESIETELLAAPPTRALVDWMRNLRIS